jgi:hypothetical protein
MEGGVKKRTAWEQHREQSVLEGFEAWLGEQIQSEAVFWRGPARQSFNDAIARVIDELRRRMDAMRLPVDTDEARAERCPRCSGEGIVYRPRVGPVRIDSDACPGCGGPADNGFFAQGPPAPYYCNKCSEA